MTTWKPEFFDDFPTGPDVDRSKWQSPVWTAEHNKANLGRTGLRNRKDFEGQIGMVPCTSENGADLRLSTYNPKAQPPGSAFLGSEIYTPHKWGQRAKRLSSRRSSNAPLCQVAR